MPISAGTEEPGAGHCFLSKTGISGPVWITVFLYSPDLKLQKEVRKDGACDKAAGVCSQTYRLIRDAVDEIDDEHGGEIAQIDETAEFFDKRHGDEDADKSENRAGCSGGNSKILRCDGHAAGIESVLPKIDDQREDVSGDAGNKVQNQHPHVAEHGFAGTSEQIKREHIRGNVCEAEMQKHGGEKTPPLSENNSGSVHCAKTVGDGGTLRPACRGLDDEHDPIDEN